MEARGGLPLSVFVASRVPLLQPKLVRGRFVNPEPIAFIPPPWGGERGTEPTFRDFWRWRRTRAKHPEAWHVPRVEPAPAALPPPPPAGIAATWVGHSSVVLQIDGRTILLDPVWSRRLAGGLVVPRYTPPGIPWSALPRLDALVVSHNHFDHLDAPTIQRVPRSVPVYCPARVGPWFRARGFDDITELSWWESAKLGAHALTFVPAQHFSGRTMFDRDRTLWGGWVVEGPEGSVAYFAGDSGYFSGFKEIGARFPRIDLAMVPAGAYEPRWFMSAVHVDPAEAGQAFLDTNARNLLPIHWGTFRLADEPIDEPPRALSRWWDEEGLDRARLHVPALGGTVRLGGAG